MDMTSDDIRSLRAVLKVMEVLCEEMDKAAPLHQGLVFVAAALADAEGEPKGTKDLQQVAKLSSAAISRIVGALQEVKFTGKPGLELLRSRMDYTDRRRRPVVLTEKGERVVRRLVEAI